MGEKRVNTFGSLTHFNQYFKGLFLPWVLSCDSSHVHYSSVHLSTSKNIKNSENSPRLQTLGDSWSQDINYPLHKLAVYPISLSAQHTMDHTEWK